MTPGGLEEHVVNPREEKGLLLTAGVRFLWKRNPTGGNKTSLNSLTYFKANPKCLCRTASRAPVLMVLTHNNLSETNKPTVMQPAYMGGLKSAVKALGGGGWPRLILGIVWPIGI